jgi:soluble lytic murein transglycosylase
MFPRHTLVYLLFFVITGVLGSAGMLGLRTTHSAPSADEESIPTEALTALRDGRYLRASLILREYLTSRVDTTESAILLAAQAEAGWGDWERVRELLEGRSWLDRVASGYGWNLLGRSQVELGEWNQGSASLGRYLAMAAESAAGVEQSIAQVRRARALAAQGQATAAMEAFDRAAETLPQIEDWIHVFAASTLAATGDTAAVRQRLARVDADLAREWAWRTEVRARRAAGDAAGGLAAAERAAERLTSESRRAAAWTLAGQIRQERRDVNGARAAFIRAMNTAQASPAAIDAARALSAMGGISAEDQLLIGRVYLRHGNISRGVAGLQAFLAAGRGTAADRERVMYDIASAHFRAGQYRDAEKALLAVAATVSDRGVASDAAYDAARAQYRDGRPDLARESLYRIIRDFPDQPAAARAAYLTADLDHDFNDLRRATEFYRTAIRIAPASNEAAMARMRLGGIAFASGRSADALREFEEYRQSHPTGRHYQQATYWAGRALAELDRTADARARLLEAGRLDPFSYYGGLAADELGENSWKNRLEHAPPVNDRFHAQVEGALARVDLLRRIGWDDAASFEMERVRRHFARFDGALYTLAEAFNERGFTSAGVALGREIYRREGAWNVRLLRIVYPFPFRSIIMAEANDRNVDPFLVAALIRQESMFNPGARSPAGAVGLMQVMPNTGRALARSLRISRFNPDMMTQPELNILLGTTYLAEQLRSYDNRLDVVLAAYNAGPGRVTRWRRFPEFSDRALFAERIPFDETRDYVRIVQNNRRIYTALYGSPAVPSR